MNRLPAHRRSAGFTLIEAIIAMVVLAAAVAGVLSVFGGPFARSADPMIQAQARSIAVAHMDEILMRDYGPCTQTGRANWDTIECYDEIDNDPPEDQFGNLIGALDDYRVWVDVDPDPDPVGDYAEITVRVAHPSSGIVDLELQSRRGDY